MKLVKYLMSILLATGFYATEVNAQIFGQETNFDRDLNTRDDQPVKEFVESKENIDVKEKASNLEISGDVRFEWRYIHEKGDVFFTDSSSSGSSGSSNYSGSSSSSDSFHQTFRSLRGGEHVDANKIPISVNDFDVEFNIKFKYNFKKAWAFAHLQFDNPAGIRGRNECFGTFPIFNKEGSDVEEFVVRDSRWLIKGSGESFNINLKRAFMGYNIWADGKHRLDIEVGRRKLDDLFDSEIEFTSRFDGIIVKFASSIDDFSDWYVDSGAFVIDENVNHFGWVVEAGLVDFMDWGLDLRYSIIDWRKHGENRCFIRDPLGAKFLISQISFTYTIHPKIGKDKELPIEFYGGFLMNHAAKKTLFTHGRKKNLGWYGGVTIGVVHKEGDWSIDLEYVAVQAQAVHDFDAGSIGRGNVLNENLLNILDETFKNPPSESSSKPSDGVIGIFPRRGNTNFTGFRSEFFYAITDNLTIDLVYEFSNEEDRRIGGRHYYQDFEIEAIYAF